MCNGSPTATALLSPRPPLGLHELSEMPRAPPKEVNPTSLTIDLTFDCLFRCRGCIEAPAMNRGQRSSLKTSTALKLIERFAQQGGEHVGFYGGECTLHPGFPEIVVQASRLMQRIDIVTNGAQLGRPAISESIREAATHSAVTVRVSLNSGRAATHELLHGVAGQFFPVVEGMKAITQNDSQVDLYVSFLVEDANMNEIEEAYTIAREVGASKLMLRGKTGAHGIDFMPASAATRCAILRATERSRGRRPRFEIDPAYVRWIRTGDSPETRKPYSACWYCANSRLVVTPPDPGVVWACTYWRGDPRFRVANLRDVPFGSDEFEQCRRAAVGRIQPGRDCRRVICNRHRANTAIWQARHAQATNRFTDAPGLG